MRICGQVPYHGTRAAFEAYASEVTLMSSAPRHAAPVRPRQLPAPERRAQILRAAAAAFSVGGYAATSVDDVAKQAGVTKLIVYRHFDSKGDLYRQVLDQVAARLGEEWATHSELALYRGAAVRTLLAVGRELPDGFRLFFVHAPREADFAGYAADFRRLQLRVASQTLTDRLPDGPRRAWTAAMAVDMLIDAVLEWLELGDPRDDAEWADRTTEGLHAALTVWLV